MTDDEVEEATNKAIAQRWCKSKGAGWNIIGMAGRGGTAPVFSVATPNGELALKLLDAEFSEGNRRSESIKRIQKQVDAIGVHNCPYLVQVHDGGEFEGRLFLLMNKAPGVELAKCLDRVPREKIPTIVDQVAKACAYLRELGLCHRDIKSANVFVSEDFNHSTLLDVSVARNIHDPIGLGTDNGGKLPVVATSRYTPPEYLFRLIDPGPELWHAVDVYQLGGIIHDLVMRTPMFEKEYVNSSENRYRFAWIVATQDPEISAGDVDGSMLLLGRRALDKDWKRRSGLKISDFFQDKAVRKKVAGGAIGLGSKTNKGLAANTTHERNRIIECTGYLENSIRAYLSEKEITAKHSEKPGENSLERLLMFEWQLPQISEFIFTDIEIGFVICIEKLMNISHISMTGQITGRNPIAGVERNAQFELPPVPIGEETEMKLYSNAIAAIDELAFMLMNQPVEEVE